MNFVSCVVPVGSTRSGSPTWLGLCHAWLQVADANAAVRLRLCMEYFSVLKQLASKDLSDADRTSLQQQLENTTLRTQSRLAGLCYLY